MTTDQQELKTPAEYFELGGVWLDAAEQLPVGNGDSPCPFACTNNTA